MENESIIIKEDFRQNARQFLLGIGIHFVISILAQAIIILFFSVRNPNPILYLSYAVLGIIAILILYFLMKKQWYTALGIFIFFFIQRIASEVIIRL